MNKLKKEIFETLEKERQAPIINSIKAYIGFIAEDPDAEDSLEYLFNILRETGYLLMIGGSLEESLLSEIKELSAYSFRDEGESAPSFFDFDDLSINMELFSQHCKMLGNIPKVEDSKSDESWEEKMEWVQEEGRNIFFQGFTIIATQIGGKAILGKKSEISWKKSWHNFQKKGEKIISQLWDIKEYFYILTDIIFSFVSRFSHIPQGSFRDLVLLLCAPKKSYPKEQGYRQFIQRDDALYKYEWAKLVFEDASPLMQVFLYEHALAEQMLIKFIFKYSSAFFRESGTANIAVKIMSTEDIHHPEVKRIPILKLGDDVYSVHIINKPNKKEWGVRTDRKAKLEKFYGKAYKGALFCSLKQYVNGNYRLRFENWVKKERLEKLIRKNGLIFPNYAVLGSCQVYGPNGTFDLREEFLESATNNATR